jgi:hypothetical protein
MACTMATIIATLLAVRADAVTPTPELPPFQVYTTPAGTEFGLTLPRANATSGGAPPRLAIALASTINDTLGRLVMSGCPSAYYFANACPWLVEQGWSVRGLPRLLVGSAACRLVGAPRPDRAIGGVASLIGIRFCLHTGRVRRWICRPMASR